jgi:hypothetical protein
MHEGIVFAIQNQQTNQLNSDTVAVAATGLLAMPSSGKFIVPRAID